MTLTLDALNAADQAAFTAALDGTYEHSPWIAAAAWARRPFASLAQLRQALVQVVRDAGVDRQLALIRAHPELAGKAMVSKSLTAESTNEQGRAGLTDCTPRRVREDPAAQRRLQRAFRLPLHPGGARAAWRRPEQGADHRDLRAAAGQPPGLRAGRMPAPHPPHRRDPAGRQVRRAARAGQPGLGLGRAAGGAQRPGVRRAW